MDTVAGSSGASSHFNLDRSIKHLAHLASNGEKAANTHSFRIRDVM